MSDLVPENIAAKYNQLSEVWNKSDKWHWKTHLIIEDFIQNNLSPIPDQPISVLLAGSAGNSHCLPEEVVFHLDIAGEKIKNYRNHNIASIENIPVTDSKFDWVICVGSVVNYTDPFLSLKEMCRTLKEQGKLILEFENSYTLELLGKNTFNKKAVLTDSFYNKRIEKLWFFSEQYIRDILSTFGFTISKIKRFHIFSPLIYRLTGNESFAARFVFLDKICRYIPVLRKFSSNTILIAQKIVR